MKAHLPHSDPVNGKVIKGKFNELHESSGNYYLAGCSY